VYNKFRLSFIEPHKFNSITDLCKDAPPGPVIEVGVLHGGMALHLAEILPGRKIYLVDTFTGIPYVCEHDNYFKVGNNYFGAVDMDKLADMFINYPNVSIMKGLFPDDFRDVFAEEMFAIIHLDVDVYKAYKDGLEYLYPRTMSGGLILLDDYNCNVCAGATKACDEFVKSLPEQPRIEVHNSQYFIRKG